MHETFSSQSINKMHEKIKLKTYNFTTFTTLQINLVNTIKSFHVWKSIQIMPPQNNLLVSKSINFISMKMSSKGTFFQDSFTHVLHNHNAYPTPATAAKQMFGKAHPLYPSPLFFRAKMSKTTQIILQPVADDTCTTIFGIPYLPRVYNYTLYNESPKQAQANRPIQLFT